MNSADLTAEPRYPCEVCGKQKARTWVGVGTGDTVVRWVCRSLCTDNLRAQPVAAEARLTRIREAFAKQQAIWDHWQAQCKEWHDAMTELRAAIEDE
jgi:hypothetical protein